ncbi:MAG: hypothetical protein R3328_05285 [Planococcaceae bacterium]|uniref:hypothetical protein n=1 Tax=Paenisporosarcina quisquiliarum TaxID=365346 RepID=UPI002422EAA7|nr:hypothetical protein [Bacillota bacterium]MDX1770919.1 hypothetical protein [Planococcaceae bacterium]
MNLAIVDHILAFGGDNLAIAANNTALKTIITGGTVDLFGVREYMLKIFQSVDSYISITFLSQISLLNVKKNDFCDIITKVVLCTFRR